MDRNQVKKKNNKIKNTAEEGDSTKEQPKRNLESKGKPFIFAIVIAYTPVLSIILLAALGVISLKSIYTGHIYFNAIHFAGQMRPPLGIQANQSALSIGASVTTLLTYTLIASYVAYANTEKQKTMNSSKVSKHNNKFDQNSSQILSAASAMLMGLGIISLGYRGGLNTIGYDDFHALPYILPAIYCSIIYAVKYIELKLKGPREVSSILCGIKIIFVTIGSIILPLSAIIAQRYHDRSLMKVISDNKHIAIETQENPQESFEKIVIAEVEHKTGKRFELFSWPFNFSPTIISEKSSKFPILWYLWYNESVEKNKNLRQYHACKLNPSDLPDMIVYKRWLLGNGIDSEIYGKCLIEIQNKYYKPMNKGEGVFINRKHVSLINDLIAEGKINLWNKPKESSMKSSYVNIKTNKSTIFKIDGHEKFYDSDVIGIQLGTYTRRNKGSLRICLNLNSKKTICAARFDKKQILDNTIRPLVFKNLQNNERSKNDHIIITDKSPSNALNANYVAIMSSKKDGYQAQHKIAVTYSPSFLEY